jgi:glycosyltransferase involved in cell wall biosynthesis
VPCFRQRDLAAAARQARRWCVPLIFDPLISAYDKQVWERFKLKDGSRAAERLLAWERGLFARADRVVADTPGHAAFFAEVLGVPPAKVSVVYVGADESLFTPAAPRDSAGPAEVLFYGSFIPLQGAQTIIEAARRYAGPPARWCLLGEGPERAACVAAAAGLENVRFESRIPYAELPARIQRADVLLGVFGTTNKAGRVIPNKVFQALAAGRPVITRASDAYPEPARSSRAFAFVAPGDPAALADAVARWATDRDALADAARAARPAYDASFSAAAIRGQLAACLAAL